MTSPGRTRPCPINRFPCPAPAHIYPKYPLLYESYVKVQNMVKNDEVPDSQRE
ncbi:MAG: hypothetical protein IT479_16325 [Xanthomonadales bacterium]|nr:hypothetical protein [Xanthomonadales bacterium]